MNKIFFICLLLIPLITCGSENEMKNKKEKEEEELVMLDVDPGVDDADALLLLLSQSHRIKFVGISITQGNTFLWNAVRNCLRVLRVANRLDIPIFIGGDISFTNKTLITSVYFGQNGFGNVENDNFDYSDYLKQPDNASMAIVKLAKKFEKKLTLIALGPLTNLAYALKLEPNLGSYLKKVFIMGGNYLGIGNETPYAEFNFLVDPSAANHVLNFMEAPITIITWELCLNHSLTWKWYDKRLEANTSAAELIKQVGEFTRNNSLAKNQTDYTLADQIAAGLFLEEDLIQESQPIVAKVEIEDPERSGEMIVDWSSQEPDKHIRLVTKFDKEEFARLMMEGIQMKIKNIEKKEDN